MKRRLLFITLCSVALWAHADAVDALRAFIGNVKTGKAEFTQTVSSPDGARKKTSSGHFEFSRPNRFLFSYTKPFVQSIVADGQKVWIYDADLNQASSRPFSAALGATPAALLAGGNLDKDFQLTAQPSRDGLDWVLAAPRQPESGFKSVQVGFRGRELAAIDIVDAFDQHSLLQFSQWATDVTFSPDTFRFRAPPGADVIEQ